jgi:hypothetical protein
MGGCFEKYAEVERSTPADAAIERKLAAADCIDRLSSGNL